MNNSMWDDITGNGAVRIAVVGVLAILALFLLVETINGATSLGRHDTPPSRTITVTGTGKATAVPDVAEITFTVEESASTVATAQSSATDKANSALSALSKDGVADKDVSTLSYNVSPQYETTTCPPGVFCPANTSTITGYQVSETIQAKVRDTSKAGTVLQDLGTLGVQNISGPDFTVDNDESVTDSARANAIADARQQAETLASELGVSLDGVVGYSENSGGYPVPMYAKAADAATSGSAAPELPTGENETTVTVSVTYAIR